MNREQLIKNSQVVIVSLIWTLPILNSHDIAAFLCQGYNNYAIPPQQHKFIKDIAYWSLLFVGLYLTPKEQWLSQKGFVFIVGGLLVACFVGTSVFDYPFMAYFGVRAILPLLLIFPLIQLATPQLLYKIARTCLLIFFIHLALQILQWSLIGSPYSVICSRPPGLFSKPNSAAFFSLFTLFLVHYHVSSKKLKAIAHLLVPLSLFLARSGTGIFCWSMLIAVEFLQYLPPKHRLTFFPVSVLIGWCTMLLVAQRGIYVQASLFPRFQFIQQAFYEADWWPDLFGKATHASWHFYPHLRKDVIPVGVDSTFAAVLYNCHKIGFLFLMLLCLSWLIYLVRIRSVAALNLTIMVGLFAFTTDVLEVYPVNVLIALTVAYKLKQQPTEAHKMMPTMTWPIPLKKWWTKQAKIPA